MRFLTEAVSSTQSNRRIRMEYQSSALRYHHVAVLDLVLLPILQHVTA
jgi:hypothetical protein